MERRTVQEYSSLPMETFMMGSGLMEPKMDGEYTSMQPHACFLAESGKTDERMDRDSLSCQIKSTIMEPLYVA